MSPRLVLSVLPFALARGEIDTLAGNDPSGSGADGRKASEFWNLIERISGGPGVFLNLSRAQLMRDYDLSEDSAGRVADLVGRATAIAFELERLEQSGIGEHIPVSLGLPKAPMHAAGAVA